MNFLPLIGAGYFTDFWKVKKYHDILNEYKDEEFSNKAKQQMEEIAGK